MNEFVVVFVLFYFLFGGLVILTIGVEWLKVLYLGTKNICLPTKFLKNFQERFLLRVNYFLFYGYYIFEKHKSF